jgi:hypothetical protein
MQAVSGTKVKSLGSDNFGHCEKKGHMDMCLIVSGHRGRAVWIYGSNFVRFLFGGWKKGQVTKIKVDTPDELPARILDAAGCIEKRGDQIRRTTRDLRTRVAK